MKACCVEKMLSQEKESSIQVELSRVADFHLSTVEEGAKDQSSETNLATLPLDMTSTYARIDNKDNCDDQFIDPICTLHQCDHLILSGKVEGLDKDMKSTMENESCWSWWKGYFHKFNGVHGKLAPPMQLPMHILVSSLLGFIGLLLVSTTDQCGSSLPSITVNE
jgi:hypothetical protein